MPGAREESFACTQNKCKCQQETRKMKLSTLSALRRGCAQGGLDAGSAHALAWRAALLF